MIAISRMAERKTKSTGKSTWNLTKPNLAESHGNDKGEKGKHMYKHIIQKEEGWGFEYFFA